VNVDIQPKAQFRIQSSALDDIASRAPVASVLFTDVVHFATTSIPVIITSSIIPSISACVFITKNR
jgi:hypothetical protein